MAPEENFTLIPFTTDQFLRVFESYNQVIYPFQWILLMTAIGALFLTLKSSSGSSIIIASLLSLLWCWTGVVYHWVFFSGINKAAYLFSLLCIVQAVIFLFAGVIRRELHFHAKLNLAGIVGALLIVYALLLYPALGFLFGHVYPWTPTFGTPCPTTIFTFGLLLWADRVPFYVLAIPFVWSMIGSTAAISLGMREDAGLFVAGLLGTALLTLRRQSRCCILA